MLAAYCSLAVSARVVFADKISKAKKKTEKKTLQMSYNMMETVILECVPPSLKSRVEAQILTTLHRTSLSSSLTPFEVVSNELSESLIRRLKGEKPLEPTLEIDSAAAAIDVEHALYAEKGMAPMTSALSFFPTFPF